MAYHNNRSAKTCKLLRVNRYTLADMYEVSKGSLSNAATFIHGNNNEISCKPSDQFQIYIESSIRNKNTFVGK